MRKIRLEEVKFLFQSHKASGDAGKSSKSVLTCLMLLLSLKMHTMSLETLSLAAANRVFNAKNNLILDRRASSFVTMEMVPRSSA